MEVMDRVSGSQQCVDRCEGGLKCVYFNARSIRNKVDELAAWIGTWEFGVVAISTLDRAGTGMVVAGSGVQMFQSEQSRW